MDKLGALESLVAAVRTGSLSGAARQRGLTQPAISQQISALEAHFGTKLLQRGKSGVRKTQAGDLAYRHALAILRETSKLTAGLETLSDKVAGHLVVTANLGLSQYILADVIIELKRRYPDLKVELRADTKVFDLARDGVDIALRSGGVGIGSGYVRKVATMSKIHVATPRYLDAAGRPAAPEDLVKLDYIQFVAGDDQVATQLQRGTEIIQAPIKIGFTAQYPDLVSKALYSDMGYAKVPMFLAADDIKAGRLEPVLPGWSLPQTDLYIVFGDKDHTAPRYTAFVSGLLDHLDRAPGIDVLASAASLRSN